MTRSLPDPDRTGVARGADGRHVGWSEWGPETGRPVLMQPAGGMGAELGLDADAVRDLGVRLLVFDRPGRGRSDPHEEGTLASWADDVRQVVHARELTRPLALGVSMGAPFALAIAAAGVVEAAAWVAGTDDLAHPAFAAVLAPAVAAAIDEARQRPAALRERLARTTAEDVAHLWIQDGSDRDRVVLEEAGLAERFHRALDAGFAQGAAAYARDVALALGAWPFAPEDVTVPVDVWYGFEDAYPSHSPDRGWRLATRLPRGRRLVVPGEGGTLAWTRGREVLRLLVRAPGRP
jgi:pimeloyl-ACP methyl ester carboxylesterase